MCDWFHDIHTRKRVFCSFYELKNVVAHTFGLDPGSDFALYFFENGTLDSRRKLDFLDNDCMDRLFLHHLAVNASPVPMIYLHTSIVLGKRRVSPSKSTPPNPTILVASLSEDDLSGRFAGLSMGSSPPLTPTLSSGGGSSPGSRTPIFRRELQYACASLSRITNRSAGVRPASASASSSAAGAFASVNAPESPIPDMTAEQSHQFLIESGIQPRCAITGKPFKSTSEYAACHIIPLKKRFRVQLDAHLEHLVGGNELLRAQALLRLGISGGINSPQNGMLMCIHLHNTFDSFRSWSVDLHGVVHVFGTGRFRPPTDILKLAGKKIASYARPNLFPYRDNFAIPSALQAHFDLCRSVIAASEL